MATTINVNDIPCSGHDPHRITGIEFHPEHVTMRQANGGGWRFTRAEFERGFKATDRGFEITYPNLPPPAAYIPA